MNQDKNIEAFNKVLQEQGTGKSYVSNRGVVPTPSLPNEYGSDLINPTQPLNVPNMPPSGTATGIIESVGRMNADQRLQAEADRARQFEISKLNRNQDEYRSTLAETLQELGLQGQRRADMLEDSGANNIQKEVDELSSQIEAKEHSIRRQVEEMEKSGGGLTSGKRIEIERIQKEGAREIADLSIILNAKNRNLLTAKTLVEQKIALETEALKTKKDIISLFYNENKEWLDKEDKRAFEKAEKEADRTYEENRERVTKLENTKFDLLSSAAQQGANNQVLMAIQNAKTVEDAIRAAGEFGGDILERQIRQAQLNKLRSEAVQNTGTDQLATNVQSSVSQLQFLKDTVNTARELASASGASGLSKFIGDKLVGDTKFRQLEAQTNTLRTNVLTLATDPNIKKFFGPQMSEADVRLMTAAGTTLNPENQSPAQLVNELERLDNLFTRMLNSVQGGTGYAPGSVVEYKGKKYRVGADGDSLTEI